MTTRTGIRERMTAGRTIFVLSVTAGIIGMWLMASEPWGLAFWELVPFMAPGALLGIGAGWMSHAMQPDRWTWKSGRNAAIVGAIALPPIITITLAILGARPERVLSSTVRAAWLSLIVGGFWALGTWIIHRLEHR